MVKSYLNSALRNLVRSDVTSLINIIGPSVAIGCCVLIFIFADSYYHLDSIHTKSDRIVLIVNHLKEGDGTNKTVNSPFPLANLLMENSAVENTVQVVRDHAFVRVKGDVFN